MLKLKKSEYAFLGSMFIFSFVPAVIGPVRILSLLEIKTFLPSNPRALSFPIPIIIHIICSSLFCLLGAIQFVPTIRRGYPKLHKQLGSIAIVSGLVSALTGLWMTHFYKFSPMLQGELLYWSRVIFGSLMVFFIFKSIHAITKRNFADHGRNIIRAYAIGQGASTQTFLFIITLSLTEKEPVGLARDILMTSSWVLNLMLAELITHYRKRTC